jgi:hypothetical protein
MMARTRYFLALLFSLTSLTLTVEAQKPYRIPDSKVGSRIHKLADSARDYNNALNKGLRKSDYFGTGGRELRIIQDANAFQISTYRLKERFDQDRYGDERALSEDVRGVLRRATTVNYFMVSNFGRTGADDRWAEVRQNLQLLAQSYNVYWVGNGISGRPGRMDDEDARELIFEIKSRSVEFRRGMESFLKVERSIDPYTRKDTQDEINHYISLVSKLKGRVDDKDGGTPVFNELMVSATRIDKFVSNKYYRLQPQIREDWRAIFGAIKDLARGYRTNTRVYR